MAVILNWFPVSPVRVTYSGYDNVRVSRYDLDQTPYQFQRDSTDNKALHYTGLLEFRIYCCLYIQIFFVRTLNPVLNTHLGTSETVLEEIKAVTIIVTVTATTKSRTTILLTPLPAVSSNSNRQHMTKEMKRMWTQSKKKNIHNSIQNYQRTSSFSFIC